MKRFGRWSFRRKTLLRAMQAVVLALFLWMEGQKATAQTYSAPFAVSGGTVSTASGSYSGAVGFYDPNNPYTFAIGAGTSVTNTSASGYGAASGSSSSPYAIVTAGGGTFLNNGTLLFGTSNAPIMTGATGSFAAVALGNSGNASVDNFGTLSAVVQSNAAYVDVTASGLSFNSASGASLTLTNEVGATLSGTGSGYYGYGYGVNAATTNAGALTLINNGTAAGTAVALGLGYAPGVGTANGAGLNAVSIDAGAIRVTNTGAAIGMATSTVTSGDFSANATGYGISATTSSASPSVNAAAITVFNSGTASGTGTGNPNSFDSGSGTGYGIYASASGYNAFSGITVINRGVASGSGIISQSAYGYGTGYGIYASEGAYAGNSGAVTVSNSATVSSVASVSGTHSAYAGSFGIYAASETYSSNSGTITVFNSGTVSANASAQNVLSFFPTHATGYGVYALSYASGVAGAITINNAGTISATATSSGSGNIGYGIYADVNSTSSNSGALTIVNSGVISATGTGSGSGGSTGTGYGIYATSGVGTLSSLYVKNIGTVTGSGSTASYGIYLGSVGAVYNSGTVTGGTAAIYVPSGSSVTLAGNPVVNGLMQGGTNASSTSTLHFDLTIPQASETAAEAAVAAAQASLPADNAAGTADSVTLNGLTYHFLYFASVDDNFTIALTPGQIFLQHYGQTSSTTPAVNSMASALGGLPSTTSANNLLNTLNAVPISQLAGALNELSPSKTGSATATSLFSDTTFENVRLDARLEELRNGLAGGGVDWSGLSVATTSDPLLGQLTGQLYAYNPSEAAEQEPTMSDALDHILNDDTIAPAPAPRWGTFITGNAILANQDPVGDQARITSTTVDVTGGVDYRIDPHWTAGLFLGYGKTMADLDSYGSRADVNDYRFGPYAGFRDGNWWANGHAAFGFNQEQTSRAIPVLGAAAHGSPEGTQYDSGIDGGYEFHYGKLTYGPIAGLQYTHLNVNGYTESGADAADLTVDPQKSDSLLASLGAKASYDIHWDTVIFRPEINASWQHECLNDNATLGAAFAVPGSASFTTSVPTQEKESVLGGAGGSLIFSNGALLFVQYEVQAQSDYMAQSISGGIRVPF